MIFPTTESIYALNDDFVWVRNGKIAVDPDTLPANELDVECILTVEGGLQPSDIAVFMSFTESSDDKRRFIGQDIGFLVTRVDTDGSGILVAGELFERDPNSWLDERTLALWGLLAGEEYSPRDFEMDKLAAKLDHKARLEALTAKLAIGYNVT